MHKHNWAFPVTGFLLVTCLLDSALKTPNLFLSLCVWCPLVSCLFIYLYICVFSKCFLKFVLQPTVFDRLLSYCTGIISWRFCIRLVVGGAIWQFLAIWRQLTFSIKMVLKMVYSERQIHYDVTMVLF